MTELKLFNKKWNKPYKNILSKIKEFDRIVVFRHICPDFDALGTQYGLANWIKENFPEKEVHTLGDNHTVFTGRLFPESDKLNDEWFNTPFLAIIVDVGDKKRIADPRFERATYKIKIDHHPATDNIFDESITDTSTCAASEIVANMLLTAPKKYTVSAKVAEYLYIALVGDSGRFQFSSTSAHTFEVASSLIKTGINITDIYARMYEKNVADLDITKFILNNFKVSEQGVAYYILNQSDLDALNITSDRGKENVNLFSNIKGINIWCSITEDVTEPCYRISIRSRNYVINEVAKDFGGGGHKQAAGAQIKDLTELDKFIGALDDVVKKGN